MLRDIEELLCFTRIFDEIKYDNDISQIITNPILRFSK